MANKKLDRLSDASNMAFLKTVSTRGVKNARRVPSEVLTRRYASLTLEFRLDFELSSAILKVGLFHFFLLPNNANDRSRRQCCRAIRHPASTYGIQSWYGANAYIDTSPWGDLRGAVFSPNYIHTTGSRLFLSAFLSAITSTTQARRVISSSGIFSTVLSASYSSCWT